MFPHNVNVIVYQASSNLVRSSLIIKAYIGRRTKLECNGSLFAIDGEIGTTNQYPWILVVGKYPDVFPKELS